MTFEFAAPAEVIFGPGAMRRSGALAARWGRLALVVTGRDPRRADELRGILREAGIESETAACAGEPTVEAVEAIAAHGRSRGVEMVIGFGGGGAVDAAKAVAGLMTNPGPLTDYLEVVGAGRPLLRPALPWMAIPTTAGTGAEATRNAVLTVPARRLKVSLRSPLLLARTAVVDPELTKGLPRPVAAATGMDALTQLIEAYVCTRANRMTDALCASAIPRVARSLPGIATAAADAATREDLAWGSLSSGLALANAGLGAVHGLASPIGGSTGAAHGAICAALLAPVMAANIAGLRRNDPAGSALERYARVAAWLTGDRRAAAEDGAAWVARLAQDLDVRTLAALGVRAADLPALAASALQASSMKANPVALAADDLCRIMASAA